MLTPRALDALVDDFKKYLKSKNDYIQHIFVSHLDECDFRGLLDGCLLIHTPFNSEGQKKIKQRIKAYAKKEGLGFVIAKNWYCHGYECTGHYLDPFRHRPDGKLLSVNEFPKDISNVYVYFLFPEHMQILKKMHKDGSFLKISSP